MNQSRLDVLILSYDTLGNITSKRACTTTGVVDGNADVGTDNSGSVSEATQSLRRVE